MPPPASATLVVGALGAVTSVGLGARASAAAIRAGVTRPAPIEVDVLDMDTQTPVPAVGHPVDGYADGFQLLGRWLRLAGGAVDDLLASGAPGRDDAVWARTALVAVCPVPSDDVFFPEELSSVELVRVGFLERLRETLPPVARAELVCLDHAGVASAIELAERLVAERACDAILLVAVDSLLDPLVLNALVAEGRLKLPDHPTGLEPGEAAAALWLEPRVAAERRGVAPLLRIAATATATDHGEAIEGRPRDGRALAACVRTARARAGAAGASPVDVYLDLNGETWRAQEWGHALVQMQRELGPHRLQLPATSLGDTGAASGAVAIVLAAHLAARRAAAGPLALVVSSAPGGAIGCVALAPAR